MISAKEASGRDQAGGAVGPGRDLMMSLPSSGGALQPNPLAQGVHHRALALLHHWPRGVPEQPGLARKLLELKSSVQKGRLCASWKPHHPAHPCRYRCPGHSSAPWLQTKPGWYDWGRGSALNILLMPTPAAPDSQLLRCCPPHQACLLVLSLDLPGRAIRGCLRD